MVSISKVAVDTMFAASLKVAISRKKVSACTKDDYDDVMVARVIIAKAKG